jgi:hypothetical protein
MEAIDVSRTMMSTDYEARPRLLGEQEKLTQQKNDLMKINKGQREKLEKLQEQVDSIVLVC